MDSDYHLVSFYLITGKIFKANMLGNCWKLIYPPFKPRYPPRGGRRNSIKTIISIILWHLKYTHTQHTRTQSLQSNSNNFFKKRRRRWYVTKGKTIFLGRILEESKPRLYSSKMFLHFSSDNLHFKIIGTLLQTFKY